MQFIIFFSIVLAVYITGNIFIFNKARHALSPDGIKRIVFGFIYWFLVITFPLGRILEVVYPSLVSDIILWTGSFWLAFMLYFFLASLIVALLRLLNRFFSFMPLLFYQWKFKQTVFILVFLFTLIIVISGSYNARNPVIRHVDITIPKSVHQRDSVHAVMISDIHLSTLVGKKHLNRLVTMINELNPEIILMPGDLVDGDLKPVLRKNSGKPFLRLTAPLGNFATTGNHDYIGGVDKAVNYLSDKNIHFLRDTAILIDSSFYIAGREDLEASRFENKSRKPLAKITENLDHEHPIILMDHQPAKLHESAAAGIDLQLSGHTHNGQLWPLNFITSALFDISNGYGKINQMHVYVSSGAGTWGPPVRLASQAEIVSLTIYFE